MKFDFKRVSKKTLSLILMVSVVLTTLITSFSVFAETNPYVVEQSSPAIPMNAGYYVKTSEIQFDIGGTLVQGSDLTLNVDASVSTDDLEIKDGKICAYTKGIYPITFEYNSSTYTYYVVVKNADDAEWVLYDITFKDYSSITLTSVDTTSTNPVFSNPNNEAFPENWSSQIIARTKGTQNYFYLDYAHPYPYVMTLYNSSGTETRVRRNTTAPGIVPFENYKVLDNANFDAPGATPSFFVLNDSVVNAFSDYTITSTIQGFSENTSASSMEGFGIFGRATLNSGKLDISNAALEAMEVNTNTSDKKVYYFDIAGRDTKNHAQVGNTTWSYLSGKQAANDPAYATTPVELTVKFDGTNITMSSDADTDNQTFIKTEATERAGGVGVFCGRTSSSATDTNSNVNVKTFKVALNNTDDQKPVHHDFSELGNLYTVKKSSPAIPMNAMSQIELSNLFITIDEIGYFGDKLNYSVADGTTGIEISGNIIKAYEKGVYPVTFTVPDTTASTTVYVVVKSRTDSEWVLYDIAFGDYSSLAWDETNKKVSEILPFPTGWSSQIVGRTSGVEDYTGFTSPYPYYREIVDGEETKVRRNTSAPGIVPFNDYRAEQDANIDWRGDTPAYFMLNNDIVNAFTDYST